MSDGFTPGPARLWIVRHGQTDWNIEGRIQGHTPTPLNAVGREQAARLAGYFAGKPFRAVYTSDLPRAQQTADILARRLGLAVTARQELRERDLGPYQGKTNAELKDARARIGSGDLADWTGMPGVEQDEAVWQRIAGEFERISAAHAGEDVLVVTHGGVIRLIVWQVLGIREHQARRFLLSNGMTLVLERRTEGWFLLTMADMALLMDHQIPLDTATAPKKEG